MAIGAGTRQVQVIGATGEMGVGKTYWSELAIKAYLLRFPQRMLIVFDPNDEHFWHKYAKPIAFDIEAVMQLEEEKRLNRKKPANERIRISPHVCEIYIQKMVTKAGLPWKERIRRIPPYTVHGDKMDDLQMRATMVCILKNFYRGLIFLDDINAYITNFEATDIVSKFKNVRHGSREILFHCQSISPIRPVMWEALNSIRVHHDSMGADKIESKLAEMYEIVKLAQLIVETEYNKSNERNIVEGSQLYWDLRSFYVVVNVKKKQIRSCTKQQFIAACETYLMSNPMVLKDITRRLAFERRKRPNDPQIHYDAQTIWIDQKIKARMWDSE